MFVPHCLSACLLHALDQDLVRQIASGGRSDHPKVSLRSTARSSTITVPSTPNDAPMLVTWRRNVRAVCQRVWHCETFPARQSGFTEPKRPSATHVGQAIVVVISMS